MGGELGWRWYERGLFKTVEVSVTRYTCFCTLFNKKTMYQRLSPDRSSKRSGATSSRNKCWQNSDRRMGDCFRLQGPHCKIFFFFDNDSQMFSSAKCFVFYDLSWAAQKKKGPKSESRAYANSLAKLIAKTRLLGPWLSPQKSSTTGSEGAKGLVRVISQLFFSIVHDWHRRERHFCMPPSYPLSFRTPLTPIHAR